MHRILKNRSRNATKATHLPNAVLKRAIRCTQQPSSARSFIHVALLWAGSATCIWKAPMFAGETLHSNDEF